MTDINQLTTQDELSLSDLLPIWSGGNSDTRKVSVSALIALMQAQLTGAGTLMTQYAAPNASGFSVAIAPVVAGGGVYLLLTPVAGYAAGTVVLPSAPVDGQEVVVSTTQAVTALTVSGGTVNGAPTTLAANSFFHLRYDGVFKAWYRIG